MRADCESGTATNGEFGNTPNQTRLMLNDCDSEIMGTLRQSQEHGP